MLLSDIVIRIKDRSHRGNVAITSDETTAKIIRGVCDARREIIRLVPKQWLRTTSQFDTVADTALYDLPADCQEPVLLRYVFNGADYILSKVESEREFYLNIYGTTVAANKPLFFYDAGLNAANKRRQLYIWPVPNAVYTIQLTYMMDPTLVDLTAANLNDDMGAIPSYLQDALWKGGLYHFLQCFDDPNVAARQADYEQAKLATDVADDRDLDSDLQFRMDVGRRLTDFRSPGTGIRLK